MLSRPLLDRVAFFGISWYAILITGAIVIGYLIASGEARRLHLPQDTVIDFLLYAIPLGLICARLYYVAFRFNNYSEDLLSIFNIREGGMAIYGGVIGGLIAALVMVYQGNNLPTPVLFAAMAIGSMAAGALWGFVPAWFKSRWGTNETLFTLMMNYVATSIVACMTNIMRGQASSLGTLNKATKAGWFPIIMGQRYTINIIVVIVLTFAMYAYLKFSKQGYEISVVGESENTARYAGINVRRVTVRTMLISGAVCGLCGFLIVAGKDQTIATTSAGGRGFTAIIVAWLAKFNTFYMALISFLLVFLERGASEIASAYSLNEYAADIITGIILFFILGSEFFINYRVIPRGAHKEGK